MPNNVRIGTQVTGVGKASSDIDKLRDRFDKLQKQGAKGFAIGAGAAITAKGFSLIGDAAGAVVAGIEAAIKASSDLHEATSLSTQVFEANAAEIQKWAAGAARDFGTSSAEALDFASKFGTAFKNVGQSLDDTTKHAETMTRLAADLGSAFNKSSAEAAVALRSGLLGESEPLRAFGVFLDEAKVKAKAAAMGMQPLNGALSDGQKVAARYAIIMEQTADSQGMFGRDVTSAADAQKRASAVLQNSLAKLGDVALPLVTAAAMATADALEQVVPGIQAVVSASDQLIGLMNQVAGSTKEAAAEADLLGSKTTPLGQALHYAADELSGVNQRARDVAEAMAHARGGMDTDGRGMAASFHNVTGASASMATSIGIDARNMGGSLSHLGTVAFTAAGKVSHAMDDVVGSVKSARSDVQDAAAALADALWDPMIAKAELAANKRDQAEQRAIIASKKSTHAQVADAKLRLLELTKTKEGILATLASYGDKAATTTLQGQIKVLKNTKHLSAEQRAELQNLINKLAAVRAAYFNVAGLKLVQSTQNTRERASGGPVAAGQTYTVGEEAEETLVMYPGGGGFVIPKKKRSNSTPPPMPSGGGGGFSAPAAAAAGLTIIIQGVSVLTPGAAEALGRQLEPVITKHQQRSGFMPRAAGAG